MKQEIRMPKLGESITEGTIVQWLKQPGDMVEKDENLLEISTDKVDSEIPSPFAGKLVELKAEANDVVEVDSVIAIIETEGGGTGDDADAAGDDSDEAPAGDNGAAESREAADAAPAERDSGGSANGNGGGVMDVEMPKLGESITEGTIVKWLKQPGDTIEKDENLLEISTDKVDSEIPSPYAGTVKELMAGEGDVVEVGSVIARIESGAGAATGESKPSPTPSEKNPAESGDGAPSRSSDEPAAAEQGGGEVPREAGGRFYSPLVRSIARKEGVGARELEQIPGSGLHGRVTKKDILAYLEGGRQAPAAQPKAAPADRPAAKAPAAAQPQAKPAPSTEEVAAKYDEQDVEIIPMDNIRKKIADHMVMSKNTSPHVYGVAEVDFTRVMGILKKHKAAFQEKEGMKLTVNPFILFAANKALADFPMVNSSVEGHTIVRRKAVNLGMAVATERGLLVPTIKNADMLNFRGLARSAYDLAIKARDKKLTLEEIQGATFTVTNYGVFGNVIGFPIINQPNVAILGVAAIKKRPVVIESEAGDTIGIRQIGFLTLSYDHRIVDGELGDKFLQRVVHYLHNFEETWL